LPERLEIPIGAQFGLWVVTGPRVMKLTGKEKSHTASHFPCVCTGCGKESLLQGANLLAGTSSGCKSCSAKRTKFNSGRWIAGPDHPSWLGGNGAQQKKRAWLQDEKSRPCTDCGRTFPFYCMEFDHVPERGQKQFAINLNQIMSAVTLQELKEERAKCDLVCSICHNHRTWERSKGLEHVLLPVSYWKTD
jgi:hypothetical protein